MDIIFVVYALGVVSYIRPLKINDGINREWLSKDNTNRLRGIMAITIVLHHLSEHTSSGRLFPVMQHMGYLLVAVFFLLSGYGLMTQYRRKGVAYFNHFWKEKILFFVIVFILDTLVYWLFDFFEGKVISIDKAIIDLSKGTTIAGSAWYILVQIVFYVFFWFSYRLVKKTYAFLVLTLLTISLMILLLYLNFPTYWIFSDLSFILGVAIAKDKEKIENILDRHYYITIATIFVLFTVFSGIPLFAKESYIICRVISAPLFSILAVLFLCKINIRKGLWDSVNTISLEIFLLHALVYEFFRSSIIHIDNDSLYTILVLVVSVLISIPAHELNNKIKGMLIQ